MVPIGYSTATLSGGAIEAKCYAVDAGVSGTSSMFLLVRDVERVTGIEPAWPAWKAGALPLSYTRGVVPRAVRMPAARRTGRFAVAGLGL